MKPVDDASMLRRVDPRRPEQLTPQGLRRIVLGSEVGDRGARRGAAPTAKPLRSHGPFQGCLVVVSHVDGGSLDQPSREALAAASILAAPHEAVVLIAVGACRDDVAAAGVDRLIEWEPGSVYAPQALAAMIDAQLLPLQARHVLVPDRGADADLGRRLAVASGRTAAAHVVEWHEGQVRCRVAGGPDLLAPAPWLVLVERGIASTALPYVGQGRRELAGTHLTSEPGVEDLGIEAGDPQTVALDEADFIVSAGNGVSDVPMFRQLAQALGAAMGASRVAVDDGRFPRSRQIGATGTTVRARGYLAFGISGAVQHLQGIKECRHVMAVNTDASAPMVQRAEFSVIADAQPLMQALLKLLASPASSPSHPAR